MNPCERIFVAIDTTDAGQAAELAASLAGHVGGIKLGKEFFTANGPEGIRRVTAGGAPLFLDLKYHDIPNTVAGAVRAALALQPTMLTVHAVGGVAMMRAAAEAAAEAGDAMPLVLAITVLTSLAETDLPGIGIISPLPDQVVRLGRLAQKSRMDGVVCAAKEIMPLRSVCGPDFKLVVPGIRPAGATNEDQKRVVTPVEAIALGADYLVIGRPITKANDPVAAVQKIAGELS